DRLVSMDVCYIGAGGGVRITYQDRELLRRLADAGVMLWFDDAGGLNFPNVADGVFFPLDFQAASGTPAATLPAHSLLNGVFRLSAADISRLGAAAGGRAVVVEPPAAEGANLRAADGSQPPGLARQPVLSPVVGVGNGLATVA